MPVVIEVNVVSLGCAVANYQGSGVVSDALFVAHGSEAGLAGKDTAFSLPCTVH